MNAGTLQLDRRQIWLAGGAAMALLVSAGVGLGIANQPWLTAGVVFGAALIVVTLIQPIVVLGIMLALGAINFSFMTGGWKGLLVEAGGLDMNGIRLIGLVAALTSILIADREALGHAIGRYGRWYALFLVLITPGVARSGQPVEGLRLLLKLAFPFLVFVAVMTAGRTRDSLERLLNWTLAGGAFIVFILAPVLIMLGQYTVEYQGRIRIPLIAVYQNPMSFYLLAVLLIAFTRFLVRGGLRYVLLSIGCAAWMGVTVTRIAVLATAAAMLGMALYSGFVSRNWRGMLGALAVGILAVAPVVPYVLQRSLGFVPTPGELLSIMTDPRAFVHALSLEGRELFWPVVLGEFIRHPIMGGGLGASTRTLLATFDPSWGTVAHNEYLRVAADTGSVGFLLFSAALISWWRGTITAGRVNDPRVREFAMPGFAIMLAFAVISLTDNPLDYYAQLPQYVAFLCAGALAAAANATREAEEAQATASAEALVPVPAVPERRRRGWLG